MLRMGWRSERVNEIIVPASICPSVHLSIHLPISHSAGDWTQSLSCILGKGCTAELCIASLVSAFITWRFCLPGTIWWKKKTVELHGTSWLCSENTLKRPREWLDHNRRQLCRFHPTARLSGQAGWGMSGRPAANHPHSLAAVTQLSFPGLLHSPTPPLTST